MPLIRLSLLVLGFAASAFAAAQADIRPGLWDMSVEFSVPADPAFKQPAISRRQCLAAADARDPGRLLAEMSVPGATGCAISDKKESSGHLEFAVKCEGIFAIGGHGSVDYTPDTLQGTLNLDFGLGDPGAAKRTGSISRITARRVGDC
jgi:Protein of unknown function (DUF3617)